MEVSAPATEIFPWNDNFATGIQLIDEQHRVLVGLINKLAGLLTCKGGGETLLQVFQELADYTNYHFATEEAIWRQYFADDAWLVKHKATHGNFFESVLNLKAAEQDKPFDNVVEGLMSFLTQWLAYHILDTDMRMAKTVLAMQSGAALEAAKKCANEEMEGAMKALVQAILHMYENLSTRTLQLTREIRIRIEAENKLQLARVAFETTLDAICIMDANAVVVEANAAFINRSPLGASAVGHHLSELTPGRCDDAFVNKVWRTATEEGHWSGEVISRTEDDQEESNWVTLSAVRTDNQETVNYVGVISNVRHLLKLQQNLHQMAHHDVLTGLPNRLLLSDRLKQAMSSALRSETQLAVCYIDLDGFKPINDQYGHAAGDLVLREIANRLQSLVRANDTVARLGGDEFVLLIVNLKTLQDCTELLDRTLTAIEEPIQLDIGLMQISASIGYTLFPTDPAEAESLLQHADAAMYEAKRLGKSRKHCFV